MRVRILWLLVPFLLAAGGPAAAATLSVTASANSGGTVTPKGKIAVSPGGSLAVTFQANDGYYLWGVTVNKVPVPITDRKSFSYQFSNVQQNQTIAGKFVRNPAVTSSSNAGGTISPKGKVFVPYSSGQSFSIAPSAGFHIADVQVDGASKGALSSWAFDSVTGPHTVKAQFAGNTYSVTTQAGPGGTIAPPYLSGVKHGQKKTFTVIPADGMRIDSITVNDVPVGGLPATGPYKLALTVTDNLTIDVTFASLFPTGLPRLNGTYRIVDRKTSFSQYNNGVNTNVSVNLGSGNIVGTFDGNGGCTISRTGSSYYVNTDINGNQSVNVSPDTTNVTSCSYTVGGDGSFALTLGSPDGTETVNGWVSTDGNVVITGGPSTDSNNFTVGTISGVRAGSGMSIGSVTGTYHLVSQQDEFWMSSGGSPTFVSDNIDATGITATFNGRGGCSINQSGANYNVTTDSSGNQSVNVSGNSGKSASCTYTITPDGVLTLTMTGGGGSGSHTVSVSADGNTVNSGGPGTESDSGGTGYSTEHLFGVKAGSGMKVSSLSGSYRIIGADLAFLMSTGGPKTTVSENLRGNAVIATFDGSGGCSVGNSETDFNINGDSNGNQTVGVTSDTQNSTSCSYTVAGNGAFTLNLAFGTKTNTVTGWASADGTSVVIGGPQPPKTDSGGTNYRVQLMTGTKVQ